VFTLRPTKPEVARGVAVGAGALEAFAAATLVPSLSPSASLIGAGRETGACETGAMADMRRIRKLGGDRIVPRIGPSDLILQFSTNAVET